MIGSNEVRMPHVKGSPGYSLVEFLVAMLILALVSLSWLTIIQVQSANRESYRREAVERLAGMMDIISMNGGPAGPYKSNTYWWLDSETGEMKECGESEVKCMFPPSQSSIGYKLSVKQLGDVPDLILAESITSSDREVNIFQKDSPVLVGELFEQSGALNREGTSLGKRIWRAAVVLRLSKFK